MGRHFVITPHAVTDQTISPYPVATLGYTFMDGRLVCRDTDIDRVASSVGTPCFVYDAQGVRDLYASLHSALSPLCAQIRFAIKANPNLTLLRLLSNLGCGMDAVSIGEVERAFLAGVPMRATCFAGVAKGDHEIRAALDGHYSPIRDAAQALCGQSTLDRGPIEMFNVESESELARIEQVAQELRVVADVAIRVNPGTTAGANDKVRVGSKDSKFGVTPEQAFELAQIASRSANLNLRGLHMHIGSQINDVSRFSDALCVMTALLDRLKDAGISCDTLDVGAGYAVSYMGEAAPTPEQFSAVLIEHLAHRAMGGLRVLIEPGRELIAHAGVLLTRVRHVKTTDTRTIVITDAGLNALIRPALYNAEHFVWPVTSSHHNNHLPVTLPISSVGLVRTDVVGPVCESSDFICRDRLLPPVKQGDVLAVFGAGAYGMSMAMTYNDHPLAAEALIDRGEVTLIRPHQSYADLYAPTAPSNPALVSLVETTHSGGTL
jgi:diaminopimelate decarboxylase